MKVIIVGMGRVGSSLARALVKEGHDIVAVENDAAILQDCVNKLDIQGICGNGCIAENLKEAGVEHCDMLIAVTPQDENNILCCMVARVLGAKHLVARVRDPEYFDQFEFMRGSLGINMLVNPEESASHEIMRILRFPEAVKVSSFSRGKVDIVEFKLPAGNKLEGLSLAEVRKKLKISVLIVAIERDGKTIVPGGNTVLKADDTVSVCAKHTEIRTFFRSFGLIKHKVQSVMILGGGRDAFYLARELEESGFSVKLITRSYDRCVEIKGELEKTQVICGNFTDRDVLETEGIAGMDAVVCMSDYDENNIVIALYARERGVEKTITVLHGDSYHGILESIRLDTAISPYRLAAAELARYLRAIDVSENSRVLAMYKIANERAEALLFNVGENALFAGKKIRELSMQSGVLIAAIVRAKNVIIPDGNTQLEKDDEIVVVSTGKQIRALEDILES